MCQANIVMQCTQSFIIEQSAIDSMSQPQLVKAPTWLRVLQVSIGAISIILSGYVLAQPGLAIFTAVQILSIALLFVGIQSTAVGTFSRYLRTSSSFRYRARSFSNCFLHFDHGTSSSPSYIIFDIPGRICHIV